MPRLISTVISETIQRLRAMGVDMRRFRKGYGTDDELSGDVSLLTEMQNYISTLAAEAGAFTRLQKIDITKDVKTYTVPAGIVSFQRMWYDEEAIGGSRVMLTQIPLAEMFSLTSVPYGLNTDNLSFLSGGNVLTENAPSKFSVIHTEAGDLRVVELFPTPMRTVADALVIEIAFSPNNITENTDLDTMTPRHIAPLFGDALTTMCCGIADHKVPDRIVANADRLVAWSKERILGEPTTTPIDPAVYSYGR